MKWEYEEMYWENAQGSPSDNMNAYGQSGWELVSVIPDPVHNGQTFYYKRELKIITNEQSRAESEGEEDRSLSPGVQIKSRRV